MGIQKRIYFFVCALLFISGCTVGKGLFPNSVWKNTEVGSIEGKIRLIWDVDSSGKFIYLPGDDPLIFIRKKEGKEIDRIVLDKAFYTDGGSIPRIAHTSENYSPWKFGPAFLVHDWLFEMKHCELAGVEKYDYEKAADIMAEVIKTQLLLTEGEWHLSENTSDTVMPLFNIYRPVLDNSKKLWDNGTCELFPMVERDGALGNDSKIGDSEIDGTKYTRKPR